MIRCSAATSPSEARHGSRPACSYLPLKPRIEHHQFPPIQTATSKPVQCAALGMWSAREIQHDSARRRRSEAADVEHALGIGVRVARNRSRLAPRDQRFT